MGIWSLIFFRRDVLRVEYTKKSTKDTLRFQTKNTVRNSANISASNAKRYDHFKNP